MATQSWITLLSLLAFLYAGDQIEAATNASTLDADTLIKLGRDYNNPLLQMLGVAFINTERKISEEVRARELAFVEGTSYSDNVTFLSHVCKLLECSTWSEWSSCPARQGEFAMATRQRQCGFNSTLCTYTLSTTRNETQSKVCEPQLDLTSFGRSRCPSNYVFTPDGFCLKFLHNEQIKDNAVKECQSYNGELVNINSAMKAGAVHNLLFDEGKASNTIWINGHRKGGTQGPYETTYGVDEGYDNWASGEPSRGTSERCKVEEGDPRRWWDRECSDYYYYAVCEIVLNN